MARTPEPIKSYGSTLTQRCLVPSNTNTIVVFDKNVNGVATFCMDHSDGTIIVAVTEESVAEIAALLRNEVPYTWKGTIELQVPKNLRPIAKTLLRAKMSWRFMGTAATHKFSDSADD